MAQITGLTTFSPNTIIRSSPMNTNFTTIQTVYNAHDTGTTAVHGVGAGSIVGTSLIQTLTEKTLTTPIIASIYQDAGKTKLMTLPNTASDTLVALKATQTLTNKTLTSPVVTGPLSQHSGSDLNIYSDAGTTLKFSVDGETGQTLVGRPAENSLSATTLDVLTNGVGCATFESNSAGSTGALMNFFHNSASPAVGDNIGYIRFFGKDSGGNNTIYASILVKPRVVTDGAESGSIIFSTSNGGTLEQTRFAMYENCCAIPATNMLYLDGGGNSGILESAADTIDIKAGGVVAASFKLTSAGNAEVLFDSVDPPTANYANANGIVKAWAAYTDGVGLDDNYNVSSITDEAAAGVYSVLFDTDLEVGILHCTVATTVSSFGDWTISCAGTASTGVTINIFDISSASGNDRSFNFISIGGQ